MKTICWNSGLVIKAENGQDAVYLTEFIKNMEHKSLLSGWIELEVGEFDSDGKLEDTQTLYLSEIDDKFFWYNDVVEINFKQYCDHDSKYLKKIINKIK